MPAAYPASSHSEIARIAGRRHGRSDPDLVEPQPTRLGLEPAGQIIRVA